MLRGGIPFSNAPGHRLRVLELRLRDPRPHRRAACRGCRTRDYLAANILKPLGMTSTTLEPAVGAGRARLALGYRWEDEQWKDEPLLPDGAFGAMGGMLTSIARSRPLRRRSDGRVAAARRRRNRPVRRASLREMQQLQRSRAASAARDHGGSHRRSMPAATATGFGIRQTCASATSSRTAAACRDSGR